jgi:hypothetical protein
MLQHCHGGFQAGFPSWHCVQQLTYMVQDTWGVPPSIVVNSAGLSREDTTMLEGSTKSWTEMMNVNVIGTHLTCCQQWLFNTSRHAMTLGCILRISCACHERSTLPLWTDVPG